MYTNFIHQNTTLVVKEKEVMKTCMGIFGFFVIGVLLPICFAWNLSVTSTPDSTPEVQDFLANFSEEHHQIITAIDRFARHDKLSISFRADTLKSVLDQLYENNVTDPKVGKILRRSINYCNEYLETIDIDTDYELWKEFRDSVVQPLYRYYYLYKANQELRRIARRIAISDDYAEAKTSELLYTLAPRVERISNLIEDFSEIYGGYFDKEGFKQIIDGICKFQSRDDARAVVKRLIHVSTWCALAYDDYGSNEWDSIISEFRKLLSHIDAL